MIGVHVVDRCCHRCCQQAIEADIVDLVTLLMASGLRLGEALSLRWTDVDLESGTLR